MADEMVNVKRLTDKELVEGQRQRMQERERIKQRAPALSPKPAQDRRGSGTTGLELADATPRCRWVRQDGTACGSPQMKNHIYCFAHKQMMEARALALNLPALEDANAIQIGIMRIQKALIEDTISTKKAGLLLYSMQLALQNVGQTTFAQAKAEEPVRETVAEEEAISDQFSAVSEKQTPFTTENTEGTEENQGLPLIHADDTDTQKGLPRMNSNERGLGKTRKLVEWTPPQDIFRMDTREGMEAYEASFRKKITGGERILDDMGIHSMGQPCANLG
jgi:hypothetical protein